MLETTIQRAGYEEIESVSRLFDAYRQFYGQPSDPAAAQAFLEERMRQDDSAILLAKLEGELVGFVQLYPTFSSVAMRRVWVLNDLFVDPDSRRLSIGRTLLRAATTFAKDSGACRLVLATAVDNTAAKALYESAGWAPDESFDHYSYNLV